MSRRGKDDVKKYGLLWTSTTDPLWRELCMIRNGGKWQLKNGKMAGEGLAFHYREAAKYLWPHLKWHHWNELFLQNWLEHRYVGVLGPTNSGKTNTAAWLHLITYYAHPSESTTVICSTTRERLEDRIWGEMKKLHRMAVGRYSWIPGNLIEGKQRIVTDDRDQVRDGRDFRNGIIGVPCKQGGKYVGLGDFIGIKNKWLYLCGDELQLLPPVFIDSLSNLMKGKNRKVTGMGNPAETTDSLGRLCEPAATLNGWDGGIDQAPKSKVWDTRWPDGCCIQLCGSDSPNNDTPPGQEPIYPFLICKADMDADAMVWGVDDWHYTMFNEGRMPRGQGSRRVLTRNLCLQNRAMEDPIWASQERTLVAFLDAAYRGVGGDRCVFGVLEFGPEVLPVEQLTASAIINQTANDRNKRQILHLIDMMVIPIHARGVGLGQAEAEDQIVKYVMEQCASRRIPPQNFFYDSGMRTSLVESFGRLWSTSTNSIDFGGTASDRQVSSNIDVLCKDYYSKFVTELWFSVRLVVEAKQFRGMTEEVLQEGCQREWKLVGKNKIEVETKAEMKLKTGRSPDLFDALVCGVEGARRLGFRIQNVIDRPKQREDQAWKRQLEEQSQKFWHDNSLVYN
jgi:hypothetical protein